MANLDPAISPILQANTMDTDGEDAVYKKEPSSATSLESQLQRNIRIIECIDLDSDDEKQSTLLSNIKCMCDQIKAKPVPNVTCFKNHTQLKLLEINFFKQINKTTLWKMILETYSDLANNYTDLRNDYKYQYRAIVLLAAYINHLCKQFQFSTHLRRQKVKEEVHECCDDINRLMNIILFDNVEHKAMVMLKTDMKSNNAFLLIVLCTKISDQIKSSLDSIKKIRSSTVILVNASLLMFNLWHQLMSTPSERQTFANDCKKIFEQLAIVRNKLNSRRAAYSQFYQIFGIRFLDKSIE